MANDLLLTAEQASQLTHLTAVHSSSQAIALVAQISSLELWSDRDGVPPPSANGTNS